MSKIRVIILQSNRKALIKETSPKKPYTKHQDGHYILASEAVANYEVDGVVEGSEIIFFQGNPNPISYGSIDKETGAITDRSGEYMDQYVMENALKQTSLGPKVDLGNLVASLSWFKSPTNLIYLLMAGVIAYALLMEALGFS